MAARPVSFAKYFFVSVSKAKAECKRVRDKYAEGDEISDPSDVDLLLALVEEHRNRDEKIGRGIEHFEVARNNPLGARSGNLGIWIKQVGRDDLVDFGYGGVIEWIANPENDRRERRRVDRALRNAIRPTTDAFMSYELASGKTLMSSLTGRTLSRDQPIDVVHLAPRWGQLVDAFLGEVGGFGAVASLQLEQSLGEQVTDQVLKEKWIEFHSHNASLGLATPEENRQRPKMNDS